MHLTQPWLLAAPGADPDDRPGNTTPKKDRPIEAWDVEIGKLTKSADGNPPVVEVVETEATIQAGPRGPVLNKLDMAMVCNCGVDDKCWAVPLSMKRWPWKLEMCNHPGEAGHQHYDSDKHVFSKTELNDLSELIKTTLASQKLANKG